MRLDSSCRVTEIPFHLESIAAKICGASFALQPHARWRIRPCAGTAWLKRCWCIALISDDSHEGSPITVESRDFSVSNETFHFPCTNWLRAFSVPLKRCCQTCRPRQGRQSVGGSRGCVVGGRA